MTSLTQLSHQVDAALTLFKAMGFKKAVGTFVQDLAGVRSRRMKVGIQKSGRKVRVDDRGIEVQGRLDDISATEGRKVSRIGERLARIQNAESAKRAATGAVLGTGAVARARYRKNKTEMRTGVSALPSHAFARPRDGDGQFVANVTGGADPVTMRQAYGEDPKKSKLLVPGAAAAALGTAGLLGGTVKGRSLLAGGLRKVEGLARSGRDKLQGRVRMSKPGRGRHRERVPGLGEVLYSQGKTGLNFPVSGD